MIDEVDISELGVRESLSEELKRFNSFRGLLGENESDAGVEEVSVRDYAKYVLSEGGVVEKRQSFANMESELEVVDKEIQLVE